MLRVGFLQFEPVFGDVTGNLARIEAALEPARGRADLLVLPELATTGYNFTSREELAGLAEPVPDGPSTRRLVALAGHLGAHLVVGLAEGAAEGRLYNSAALLAPAGWIGTYRKVHLYDREKLTFEPGDLGFPVHDLSGPVSARVGMMVCFDWRFPEAARRLALAGADVIAHPSNLVGPWCPAAMITRCLENRVFAVTANRTGAEDRGGHRLAFTGRSQVVDPDGVVRAAADESEERLEIVEIDLEAARKKSINANNDLFGDRHPEYY
jgi:predicted amidohydrolase